MSEKTRAALITELGNTIFPNTSEQIDPATHATLETNIIDSYASKLSDSTLLGLFKWEAARTYVERQGVTHNAGGTWEFYIANTTPTQGVFTASQWDQKTSGGTTGNDRAGKETLVAATPKAITFSSTLGTTNYSLTANARDASGDPVDVKITAESATGFTAESIVNSTLNYSAIKDI